MKKVRPCNQAIFAASLVMVPLKSYANNLSCDTLSKHLHGILSCEESFTDNHTLEIVVPQSRENERLAISLNALLNDINLDLANKNYAQKKRRLVDANIHMHSSSLVMRELPKLQKDHIFIPLKALQPYRIKVDFRKPRYGKLWHEIDTSAKIQISDWNFKLSQVQNRFNQSFGAENVNDRKRLNGHTTGITTGISSSIYWGCVAGIAATGYVISETIAAEMPVVDMPSINHLTNDFMSSAVPTWYGGAPRDPVLSAIWQAEGGAYQNAYMSVLGRIESFMGSVGNAGSWAYNNIYAPAPALVGTALAAPVVFAVGQSPCWALSASYDGFVSSARNKGKTSIEKDYAKALEKSVAIDPRQGYLDFLSADQNIIKNYRLDGFLAADGMHYRLIAR